MGGMIYRELVHELASLPTPIVNFPVPIIGSRKTWCHQLTLHWVLFCFTVELEQALLTGEKL